MTSFELMIDFLFGITQKLTEIIFRVIGRVVIEKKKLRYVLTMSKSKFMWICIKLCVEKEEVWERKTLTIERGDS